MEYSSFFNSENGDRKYKAEDWDRHLKDLIKNGIFKGGLQATADGSGMSITLQPGKAWINGKHYENDQTLSFPIDAADGTLNRIDRLVLCLDYGVRTITARVKKGTFASAATAPELQRDADKYELCLATISIPAGTSEITQSLITDTRLDNAVCGIVTGAIDQVDTTTFYNQIAADLAEFKSHNEADFTAWFQGIRDTLGEDAAGKLQNQIDAILAAKGQPNGIATLDADGHIPAVQLNMSEPNYAGKLVVHVTTSDGGSVGDTRVRITQAQLGANFIQPLDALDTTTFQLLENHVYSVVLIDYPTQYYGGADTVQIAGGTTKEITIELDTEPDIIGIDINGFSGEIKYTDDAVNWNPAYYDTDHNIHYGSFEDSWLLRLSLIHI